MIENSSSRPDYRLRADGAEVLLDVEDFTSKLEDSRVRGGAYNPYGPIREKLSAARRKFKDMEGHCCCLILQNPDKLRIDLSWQIVMGAMLGDLTFPSLAAEGSVQLIPQELRGAFRERKRLPNSWRQKMRSSAP